MKVLHYTTNFLNPSETFIQRLIENHRRFKPVAMCINKRKLTGDYPLAVKPDGLRGAFNSLCFHLNWCLPFYTQTIRSFAPDIIHAHFGIEGYRMIKPSRKTKVPLVVSFHGSDVWRLPSEFDWPRRYRNLARHAKAFTTVSDLMKKELVALGFPRSKIHIARCGLSLNEFTFNTNYSPKNSLMMVGRMVEKKGFIYGLEALKMLKEQGYSFNMDIYGDGPLKDKLQKKAVDWKIQDLVHFRGLQPNIEICKALQNHSALIVPSVTASDGDREGLPTTLLEGMASGIPVIATRHSAIPEAISNRENGLLVDEKHPDAIARKILLVRNGKEDIKQIREHARSYVEQNHDIHQMVRKIETIYDDILL